MISIIVAVDKNFLIGNGDVLPWNFKEDLKYFKEKTMGKFVIFGSKTYRGIKKPFLGRKIIVLSKEEIKGVSVARSIEEALSLTEGEVMIAGGRSIYEQFLKIADRIYLTRINDQFEGDVYFPEISNEEWDVVEEKKGENPTLTFQVLDRKS
jgi:dihydrofolate reductase